MECCGRTLLMHANELMEGAEERRPEEFDISLTCPTTDEADRSTLSDLLYRIGQQKGSFRTFTTSSLLTDPPLSDPPRPASALLPTTTGKKTPGEVREAVLEVIGRALNESALALDFTSLLISSHRPSVASSISPALASAVPLGSLASLPVASREKSTTTTTTTTTSDGRGFKGTGLSRASEILRGAARRIGDARTEETAFWRDVLYLMEDGWPVSKVHDSLVVRYGPTGSQIVPLRRKKGGGGIDPGVVDVQPLDLRYSLT